MQREVATLPSSVPALVDFLNIWECNSEAVLAVANPPLLEEEDLSSYRGRVIVLRKVCCKMIFASFAFLSFLSSVPFSATHEILSPPTSQCLLTQLTQGK